jgi:hypothetical protein
MGGVALCLVAYSLIALIEVPRLKQEGRERERRAFWVLLLLSLPLVIWKAAGGFVPPFNQVIAAVVRPVGQMITGLLE